VKDDGLCFYRAVLKGLQENPTPDTATSYIPSKEETMEFVREVQEYLTTNKTTAKSINSFDDTAETVFNREFARKGEEAEVVEEPLPRETANGGFEPSGPPLTAAQKEGRIHIAGKYYKMNFDEFLRRMILPDDTERPYAEVYDAGIGLATAYLKDKVLVIYVKEPDGSYTLRDIYNKVADDTTQFPLTHVLFLESAGENHFHLLQLAPDTVWPKVTTGGSEILDLGDPIVRRYTRRNKSRHQK
jgi:hypothetical protein